MVIASPVLLLKSHSRCAIPTIADARPQILPLLQHQLARQTAYTNLANSFIALANKNGDHGFTAAASAFNLPVRHTPLFAVEEPLAGIDAGKEFRDAAFDLDPSQAEGRYNVVQGENFIYAIAPLGNSPAHMPDLDEVIDRVRPLATDKARAEKFHDYLETLHKDLVKGGRETPLAVAKANALNVSTSITFSVSTLSQNTFENFLPVARAALHLQPGELSESTTTEDGEGAFFVYMTERHPGDPLSSEMIRPKARATVERARNQGLAVSWMEWTLARKGLVLTPKRAARLAAPADVSRAED